MKKINLLLWVAILIFGIITNANADPIVNGGFETGNFKGWTASGSNGGSASVVKKTKGYDNTPYTAPEGKYFAKLKADAEILQKNLSWQAGQSVDFSWAFLAEDYIPYNDFAIFTIDGVNENYTVKLSNVSQVGNYGDTGWKTYSYLFTSNDSGFISFGSKNVLDQNLDSVLLVDNVQISGSSTPVPEPTTVVLLGLAMIGVAMVSKRVKNIA